MVPRLFAPIFSNEGGGFSVIGKFCLFFLRVINTGWYRGDFRPCCIGVLPCGRGGFLSFYGFCKVLSEVWAKKYFSRRGKVIVFFQQLVNGLTLGSAYAVIAIGYTLVFGVLNIVNMAHGGIFMIGAYIGLLLVTEAGMNIFPALAGAMIGGAVLGYGLELLALRPLRKHKATHLAPLISTIGVSTFLESVALMVWGPQTRSFPSAFGNELMDMGVFKISGIQIISLGTAVVLMVLLTVMLNRTKVGKAIRATSENAETAGLLGINTGRIITLTVMLASALGAAAGVLIGLSFNAIEPTMGTSMGLKGLAVLIMGGLGNVEGAMAGGFILGIAEVFSVAYGTSSYRDAVAFGLIILILFIRPEGLFAKAGKGGRP